MIGFMVVVPFRFENLPQRASRRSLAVASPVLGLPPPQAGSDELKGLLPAC